mgnify:FL=1
MNLDIFTNKMRMAFQTPRIIDMTPRDLSTFITSQIVQSYIMVGYQTYNEKDICVLTAKLSSDLQESYPYLHRGEIVICFELGAKGEYGDYTGVNLRTFCKWLKAYKTSDLRYRVIKQMEQEKEVKALPAVSREYNEQSMNQLIIKRFYEYKSRPDLDIPFASILYQELQSRGFIRNSLEEKLCAMAQFSRWRPQNNLHVSEDYRQAMIKLKAQEWLLKQYFNSLARLPFEG